MNTLPSIIPTTTASALPVAQATIAANLARHAEQARGAFAANTERAVRADTAIFSAWCSEHGHSVLPANPDAVAAFLDAQAGIGKAPATLRRYIASIAHMHRAASLPSPTGSEAVKLAMRRISRAVGTRQRQAQGITRREAELLLRRCRKGAAGLRDAALLLVARDALLRRSEAVALDVADLTIAGDGSGTVIVRRSKVDQTGEGSIRWIAPRTVQAVQTWLTAAQIEQGAIFRSVHRSGSTGERLEAGEVSRILKRMAARAGIDPTLISGHSLRVGMAQDLTAAGCELPSIMQAGGWASARMPARYAEHQAAGRGAVAQFYGAQ